MLAILLFLLKLIGLLLLVIIGILLVILLSILFVPIRYRLDGTFLEEKKKGEVQIRWGGPFFLAKAGYEYGDDFFYFIRICGLLIFASGDRKTVFDRFSDWKKRRKKKESEKEKHKKEKEVQKYDIEEYPDPIGKEDLPPIKEMPKAKNEDIPLIEEQPVEEKTVEKRREKWYNAFKKVWEAVGGFAAKIEDFLEQGERRIEILEEKIEDLYDKYEILETFYYKRRTNQVVQRMIALIRKIIFYILPRKWRGYVRYGFPDPSWTGKTYGALCISGIALQKDFHIEPEFQEACLQAEISVRGRMRVCFFARIALMLFFDKELKAVYREGKEIIGGIRS